MMNKRLKLSASLLLVLIISIACAFTFTGCDDEVEQIYVTNSHSPRLNYVQGQDLDLSDGKLTVVVDGEETLVSLTDESVSVTGYDKNTLGEQTLTVSYGELSTSITVKVIARTVAEGFEKQYFIGDAFNAAKGKIRIAKDDATTFTVNMNAKDVTLKSFDSSTPGTKTVTMQYTDGTTVYDCTFNVEVYGASDVTIVYPTKTNYYTHDTGLDFSGGYLTVKAGADGSIVRHVDITADMVSGFDLSAATPENRTTPLSQKLTVKYLDKTFEYTIKITYSGVSVINDLMETLKSVDLEGEEITLTDAEAAAAVEAITEYYKLTNRQKQLIKEEDLHRLVRCAVAEVNELYFEALEDVSTTLAVKNNSIALTSKSCEDTVADIAKLKDPDHLINVYGEILRSIRSDFPELILTGETKVADTVVVIAEDGQNSLIDGLEHIVELHGIMSVVDADDKYPAVPKDWTVATLSEYEETILEVVDLISRETFLQGGQSGIYTILSTWRENNDFFEIIYSYYLYSDNEEYTDEYIRTNILAKLPMPKVAGQWYSLWYNATYISQILYSKNTELYLYDVTQYMYYFDLLLEKTEEIMNNTEDTFTSDILKLMDYTALLTSVRASYCGYYYHAGILAGTENFEKLWDSYLELYKLYASGELVESDGKFIVGENADKFDAVMDGIEKLSPSELYGFLSSLNFLYGNSRDNKLVLSKAENGYYNTLTLLMHAYYKQTLGDEVFSAFEKLMTAMESFALIDNKATALDDFKTAFGELKSLLEGYSTANREKFQLHFKTAYDKYLEIYNVCTASDDITLSASANTLFNSLKDTISKIVAISNYISSVEPDDEGNRDIKSGTYVVLFALYEKAEAYYNEILKLNETDSTVLMSLYTKKYTIDEKEMTLEKAFYSVGKLYASYITGFALTLSSDDGKTQSYPAYEIYITTNLNAYLEKAADLLYAQYYEDYSALTKEYVLSVIDAFYATDLRGVSFLRAFEGTALHFDALSAYLADALSADESTLALANKLIEAGKNHLEYAMDNENEDKKNAFITSMDEAIALRTALADTANFDAYLSSLYTEYLDSYNAIKNPTETE